MTTRTGVAARRAALGAALAAVTLVAAAGPAGAGHVGCGAILTSTTTLDGDITGCAGDGLVIGAPGITLDLNGHRITGVGTPESAGVRNPGYHGVTIKDGTSDLFDGAIQFFDHGIVLASAKRNVVTGLFVNQNTEAGISLRGSHHNRIASNHVDNNRDDSIGIGRGDGILLRGSHGNRILHNEASAAGNEAPSAGIALYRSRGNRIQGNNGFSSFFAIALFDDSDRNAVFENEASRFQSDGGVNGIGVFDSDRTIIRRNEASSNGHDGIYVALGSRNTTVDRNVARQNSDDGIDIEDPSTYVARNVANENFDLGIEAVPGTRDGGGNRASGNGNPLQCVGVRCS